MGPILSLWFYSGMWKVGALLSSRPVMCNISLGKYGNQGPYIYSSETVGNEQAIKAHIETKNRSQHAPLVHKLTIRHRFKNCLHEAIYSLHAHSCHGSLYIDRIKFQSLIGFQFQRIGFQRLLWSCKALAKVLRR